MEAGEGVARLGGWAMAYNEDGGGVHAGTGSGGSYAPLGERLFVWFVVAMIMLAIGASVIQLIAVILVPGRGWRVSETIR